MYLLKFTQVRRCLLKDKLGHRSEWTHHADITMHEIITHIEIHASPRAVWSVLTDFARHPEWNPFVRSIEGVPSAGATLSVHVSPPGGKGMTFKPVVLKAKPGQELRWLGRVLLPGLFDGEHYFRIEPVASGIVRFVQGERFSGLLVPLFKSGLERGTRAGFEAMNAALKARVEQESGNG